MVSTEMVAELLRHKQNQHTTYIEPFIGGGSIFWRMAQHFDRSIGSDTNADLVLMYRDLLKGWDPPDTVTEQEHRALKFEESSGLRAFVGFGCSYGAVWYGGYVDGAASTRRTLLRETGPYQERFKDGSVNVMRADYRTLKQVSSKCFIYCDPPYAFVSSGLYRGGGTKHFDIEEFWIMARSWSDQGATVLISEYDAPEWVPCVWERMKLKTVGVKQGKERPYRLEKIYKLEGTNQP